MYIYSVKWRGVKQPIGGHTFEAARTYINNAMGYGTPLKDFELLNNYGKLDLGRVLNGANPEALTSYTQTY